MRRWDRGLGLALAAAMVWVSVQGRDWTGLGRSGVRAMLCRELPIPAQTAAEPVTEAATEPVTEAATQAPTEIVTEPPTQAPALPAQLLEAPEEEPTERVIPPVDIDPVDLELSNDTKHIELELSDYLDRTPSLTLSSEGPQILIMHTHATEAYTMDGKDQYTPSDTARTTDEDYNMIRVGEEMKAVFADMGLEAIHDTTLYDYPGYNGSYARSLKGIQGYLERYPTISIVLDVHRDALIAADGTAIKLTQQVDGETAARVMLVVGTDDGGLDHPNWRENLAMAVQIQSRMLMEDRGFPRALNLRSQRFNQHMTPGSLLVEVGSHGNTLAEALGAARCFARAAGAVLGGL